MISDNKNNAFDLLRLLLALSVIFSHSFILCGYKADPIEILSKHQTNLGEIAVYGFFSLSGYLITASFVRSKNFYTYTINRIFRIMPGFWVCLLVTGFIIAPLIYSHVHKTLEGFSFKGNDSSLAFFTKNMFLGINLWSIGDVINKLPYPNAINGSLWSLVVEFRCYLLTMFCGLFGLFNSNRKIYLIFVAFIFTIYAINLNFQYGPSLLIYAPDHTKLYVSYLVGSLIFLYKDHIKIDTKGLTFTIIFTLILIKSGGFKLMAPILISIICINGFSLFKWSFKYDISYGLYIYGFAIQQLLVAFLGKSTSLAQFIIYTILSITLTSLVAIMSFTLVERPFLQIKKYIVSRTMASRYFNPFTEHFN